MNPIMLLVGFIAAFIGFLLGALVVWLGVLKIAKAGRADSKEHMDQSLFYMKERNQIDRLTCSHLGRIAERLENLLDLSPSTVEDIEELCSGLEDGAPDASANSKRAGRILEELRRKQII